MYVVRHEFVDSQKPESHPEPASSLLLRSLDKPDQMTRFDTYKSKNEAQGSGRELYDMLFEVRGSWKASPTHAVISEWQLINRERIAAFEESRLKLFEVRRRVLETFAYDWLLRRVGQLGKYVVLGLYGDEKGARLCRAHPEIQRFTQANPAANYTAQDLAGLRFFSVESHRVERGIDTIGKGRVERAVSSFSD